MHAFCTFQPDQIDYLRVKYLANSVHLLERAGIPAPDIAYGGPVGADT